MGDDLVTYRRFGFYPVGATEPVAALKCDKCLTVIAVYASVKRGLLCEFCYPAHMSPSDVAAASCCRPAPRQGTADMADRRLCGFVPYPDNGAYGHWTCGEPKWHLSRHRFINYTIPRIPRFWRLRFLWREIRCTRRLRRIDKPGYRTPYRFRRALYPAKYEPIERAPQPPMHPRSRCATAPVHDTES